MNASRPSFRTARLLVTWVAAGFVLLGQAPALAQPVADLEAPEYIVVLRPGPGAAGRARQLARGHNGRHVYRSVFKGFSAPLPPQARRALLRNPNVLAIEPSRVVRVAAESLPAGVDRVDAERGHANGFLGLGARVAVVDTGIDLDHPDLRANVDRALSATFISKGKATSGGDDDHGHGTHVAGTIAAALNGLGVVGVAPAARLVALKVLNHKGSGTTADIIAALDAITTHNLAAASYADMIHVANFSLGGPGGDTDSAYRRAFDACVASGCFIVVAAGNESQDAANSTPAAYESVCTVSAMDPDSGRFASFSNYGRDVDLAAPGVDVYSTTMHGGYGAMSGTSMAAPHVAGGAALWVSQNLAGLSGATAVSAIRAALLGSGEYVGLPGDPDGVAEPLLDAERLLGPIAPPEPGVVVALASDAVDYPVDATTARLSCQVRDEAGNPLAGLEPARFTAAVDGVSWAVGFTEVSGGTYEATLDLTGLAVDVSHTIQVTVHDARGLVGQAALELRRVSAASVFVAAIRYRTEGPRGRDLVIELHVRDSEGNPVSGAQVDADVYLDGALYGSGRGALTDATGMTSYRAGRAPSGHYTTSVVDVLVAGSNYDPARDAADPGFQKR